MTAQQQADTKLPAQSLAEDGFWISPILISGSRLASLSDAVDGLGIEDAGDRDLLSVPFCRALALDLRAHPLLSALLPAAGAVVQCTYFEKSASKNWLVPLHQDLAIPVLGRTDDARLSVWSEKSDGLYVQPPEALLAKMVAVRLHLDDCGIDDGPLRLVPRSQQQGRLNQAQSCQMRATGGEQVCIVKAGAALVFKPLTLHASSKSSGISRRRVLHFLFGPVQPGYGLQWRATTCEYESTSTTVLTAHD